MVNRGLCFDEVSKQTADFMKQLTKLNQCNQKWTNVDKIGQNGQKCMDKNGQKMDKNGLNGQKLT